MKLFKKTITLLFILVGFFVKAQEMTEGFANLENGEFNKAELFFTEILKNYPKNKTAQLCYARAVGLNKQPEKAMVLFTNLQTEYPNDLEIKLNYAECLLWNKKFEIAKIYYTKLVDDNPTNFVAHLGLANTLSNLKEFEQALFVINQALGISYNNTNALISRKYIKLGYANVKIGLKQYTQAETLYNQILTDFANDKETLINMANLYLISQNTKKATAIYQTLSATAPVLALNGLSLVQHIAGNQKKALKIAQQAIAKDKQSTTDLNLTKQTQERLVQALIWNKKFRLAQEQINQLNLLYKNENWLLALSASLAIYKSNFKQSIIFYKNILTNDSKSFDGNLGIANAYYGLGNINLAIDAANKTLDIFNNQNDAVNFLKKIYQEYTPNLEQKISYSFDNGSNTASTAKTQIIFPVSAKWSINTSYQYLKTQNTITNVNANTQNFLIGGCYKFNPKISLNITGGITSANAVTVNYSSVLWHSYFTIKPVKLQDLEIGYKRDLQNFNTDLIDKKIAANHYYFNYNIGSNFKLGWFTQYFHTTQSDNNTRDLLFTSLYYNFLSKPMLKAGFNYQYLGFANQLPNIYFSPNKFNAYEIFIELLKDEKIAKTHSLFYTINMATGFQYIENLDKQATYRIQALVGYKLSARVWFNFYGLKSNIASAAASGFTYTEIGVQLKWNLYKQPIFNFN